MNSANDDSPALAKAVKADGLRQSAPVYTDTTSTPHAQRPIRCYSGTPGNPSMLRRLYLAWYARMLSGPLRSAPAISVSRSP